MQSEITTIITDSENGNGTVEIVSCLDVAIERLEKVASALVSLREAGMHDDDTSPLYIAAELLIAQVRDLTIDEYDRDDDDLDETSADSPV